MINNKIILFGFILLTFGVIVKSQFQIPLFTQTYGYFDNIASWTFDPLNISEVGISNSNGTCIARYAVSKDKIHVGYYPLDRNITFILLGSVSVNEMILNNNVTVHFDNIDDPNDSAEIMNLTLSQKDSIVLNTGRMSGKKTQITNYGLVQNYGELRVGLVQNTKAQVLTSTTSFTQINDYSSSDSYSLFSGTVNFNNVALDGGILLKQTSETIFRDSSTTLNVQNIAVTRESSLQIENSVVSSVPFDLTVKCKLQVTDSSSVAISSKSELQFTNTSISLTSYAKFNITNSDMYTDSNINMKSNTLMGIMGNGFLGAKNLFVNDYSVVEIHENSKFESNNLLLLDNSKMKLDSSSIDIGIKSRSDIDEDDQIIELPDASSTLVGLANSSSITAKNSSSIVISGTFGMINTSSISISSGSTMSVTKSFRSFDKTLLTSLDSSIEIKDEFDINDESSFLFNSSKLDISGSFNVNSNKPNVQRDFLNSNINIDGKLFNIGKLSFEKSIINLNKNFTTIGSIKSNQTNYSIQLGQFNVYGFYDGSGDRINLSSGQMNIAKLSTFSCENCEIESNGNINQAKTSKLQLLASSFTNNLGSVVLGGDFSLDAKSLLKNSGLLELTTDIVLNDNRASENDTIGTMVLNQGSFYIKGENATNVYVDFENRGSLLLQQNSIFHKKINQFSGNISISSQVDLQSNQTIQLDGGSLFGNGSVTATNGGLNNTNATLGSSDSFYQLKINGNYNQGQNATMIVTIDNSNTVSLVNINGSAVINGTLIVRMNINMVQDSSNYNKSMTIMKTSDPMEGGYSKIQFKTYDPTTGEEIDDTNGCNNYELQSSSSSFSVLLMGNTCGKKDGLTTAQIIGIAVGGFVFVAIGVMVASYFVFTKYRYSENSIRLKKIISKFS